MGRLSLRCLGIPVATHDGIVCSFRSRKALALLIYLAVEQVPQSCAKLTALFWPEVAPAQARATLRTTLAFLRTALAEPSEGVHLQVRRDTLALLRDGCDLDLLSVEVAQRDASDEELLQRAVERCSGPFLDGFSLPDAPDFDSWAVLQRVAWQRRGERLYARLAALQLARGAVAAAQGTVERWLALAPHSEGAYRQLIAAQIAAGDRAAALASYAACRAMLAHELDAAPSPETAALLAETRPQQTRSPATPLLPPRRPWSAERHESMPPFSGRARELERLVACLHAARGGQTRVVTIEGEAGIGKSRLAEAFLDWSATQQVDLLWGGAIESGGRVPYQPLTEALRRRLDAERAPDDLLSDVWLSEISRLLPELRERYPDLDPPVDREGAAARSRLFEAIARLVQALATTRPLVFWIDDAQWSDVASRDALLYALRRWREAGAPVLLLLGLRREALYAPGPLRDWIESLARSMPLERLEIGPLDRSETANLVAAVTAPARLEVAGAVGDWIYAETGGQPLWVIETVKTLAELSAGAGSADLAALRGLVPPGVRAVIRSRLQRLSTPALNVVQAAATLGGSHPLDDLGAVAGLAQEPALVALEEALAVRLLVEAEHGGEYRAAHDRIREVAYTEAGEARRRVYHGRALALLERRASPALLAAHAFGAGRIDAGSRYSIEAGEAALTVFAVRDAIGHFEQVVARMEESPAGAVDPHNMQRLFIQLGRAHELNGGFQQAYAAYESLRERASARGDLAAECVALNRMAAIMPQVGKRRAEGEATLRLALDLARRSGDRLVLAETEWGLSRSAFYSWEGEAIVEHATRALAIARELGLQELAARSLNLLASGIGDYRHDWEGSLHCAEEAAAIFAALGNRPLEIDSLAAVAKACIQLGRPREALTAARTAWRMSEAIEHEMGKLDVAPQLALALLDDGLPEEALPVALDAAEQARALGAWTPVLLLNLLALGSVQRALSSFEQARATHEEAWERLAGRDWWLFRAEIPAELCADCAALGDWPAAVDWARRHAEVRERYPRLGRSFTRREEIEALLRAGDPESARALLDRAAGDAPDNARYRIDHLCAAASLERWQGDRERAAGALAEAGAIARRLGLRTECRRIAAQLSALSAEPEGAGSKGGGG